MGRCLPVSVCWFELIIRVPRGQGRVNGSEGPIPLQRIFSGTLQHLAAFVSAQKLNIGLPERKVFPKVCSRPTFFLFRMTSIWQAFLFSSWWCYALHIISRVPITRKKMHSMTQMPNPCVNDAMTPTIAYAWCRPTVDAMARVTYQVMPGGCPCSWQSDQSPRSRCFCPREWMATHLRWRRLMARQLHEEQPWLHIVQKWCGPSDLQIMTSWNKNWLGATISGCSSLYIFFWPHWPNRQCQENPVPSALTRGNQNSHLG